MPVVLTDRGEAGVCGEEGTVGNSTCCLERPARRCCASVLPFLPVSHEKPGVWNLE